MRVLITGATGFVGRALVLRLLQRGDTVVAWTRDAEKARDLLGAEVEIASESMGTDLAEEAARADAVVNLAGANLFAGRWTASRKRAIRESRVRTTRAVARGLSDQARPQVLVSTSAVGYYGPSGDELLDETSPAGDDFLASVCADWEAEARAAEEGGNRVAILRFGVILGSDGGALAKMRIPFQLGLGGPLGDGEQWMSWVHLHDVVGMITTAIDDPGWSGPFNVTAPDPVTNHQLSRALARALDRPCALRAPAFAMKLALGEASTVLLDGQRVAPRAALDHGYTFLFPTLEEALHQTEGDQRDPELRDVDGTFRPMSDRPPARHLLEQETIVPAPMSEVFPFFSRAPNLGLLTPDFTGFHILEHPDGDTVAGSEIAYTIALGGVPMKWRTLIAEFVPGEGFVDAQLKGPYALWWHEHRFEELDGGTVRMVDRVHYTLPLGPLGRLAHRLVVGPMLRRIFSWRTEAVALRFTPRLETTARQEVA